MAEITCISRVRRRVCAAALGFAISAIIIHLAHAQTLQPFSVITGQPNLTALPGQNVAQQAMAQSVNNVCPTISTIAATPGQINLATICKAMTLNALAVQGQTPGIDIGHTTFGLNASGLNSALQQLNGGAELLVPTTQASVVQTLRRAGKPARSKRD